MLAPARSGRLCKIWQAIVIACLLLGWLYVIAYVLSRLLPIALTVPDVLGLAATYISVAGAAG